MKASDYNEYVGRRIDSIEYESGDEVALLILSDGSSIEVSVEPTYDEEE